MNKPVYISTQEMALFYGLSQGSDNSGGEQAGLGDNLRPRQNLNRSAQQETNCKKKSIISYSELYYIKGKH